MVNLKARLRRAREGVELGKHDRRVLDHLEQLDTQEVGDNGGAASPVSLALLDLAAELDEMKAEYEVLADEWNGRHPGGKPRKSATGRRNTAAAQRFALSRGLVEPLKGRLGWDEVESRTYRSGGNGSGIDYYLVSKVG